VTKKHKRPKVCESPPAKKEPKAKSADLDRQEIEKIAWRFSIVDLYGPWGWKSKAGKDWWSKIFPKLKDLESMTWAAIMDASGGKSRGHGNNSHFVPVSKLAKQAKERLKEIGQEDLSDLFSLRLDGKTRIYGIRDGRALKLLWYDPSHTVCQVTNK